MRFVGTLRTMLMEHRRELLACAGGLAFGWTLSVSSLADSFSPAADEIVAAEQEIVEADEAQEHDQEWEERFIKELAREFKIGAEIVRIVHRYSQEYVDKTQPEWRLLRSPESVTYIVLSMIHAESKGDPEAVGDGGRARGLTQIWHTTAQGYGEVTAEQLLDPEVNIRFSFMHFHHLLKKYKGNFSLALYAWNRGSTKVDRLIRYGHSPANGYGRKVYQAALRINDQMGN